MRLPTTSVRWRDIHPLRRLWHPAVRHHTGWFATAVLVMFAGSAVAAGHVVPGPKIVLETLGFLLHGFGAFPLIEHGRPIWALLAAVD